MGAEWIANAKKSAGYAKYDELDETTGQPTGKQLEGSCYWARNIAVVKHLCYYPMLALHLTLAAEGLASRG